MVDWLVYSLSEPLLDEELFLDFGEGDFGFSVGTSVSESDSDDDDSEEEEEEDGFFVSLVAFEALEEDELESDDPVKI